MIEAIQSLSLSSQVDSQDQKYKGLFNLQAPHRLDSLSIQNFKSFQKKTYVGPFLNFTSVVGPNGAGKSNILQALIFCLCSDKGRLNYFDHRELIHREGKQTYQQMAVKGKTCSVEAKFEIARNQYLYLRRELDATQKQTFLINHQQFPQKVYESMLNRWNLKPGLPNYAICQGQVDKLITKTPIELTNHFQLICGSSQNKRQQDELQIEVNTLKDALETRGAKINKLKKDKKNLKSLKSHKNQNSRLEKIYEDVINKIFLTKAYLSQLELNDFERKIDGKKNEQKEKIKLINDAKAKLQKDQVNRLELQKKIQNLSREIAEASVQLRKLQMPSGVVDGQIVSDLRRDIEKRENFRKNLICRRLALQQDLKGLQSQDLGKEYLQLYSQWQKQNQAANRQLMRRRQQYLYVQGILQTKRNVLDQFRQKDKRMLSNRQEELKKCYLLEENIKEITIGIEKMKIQIQRNREDSNREKVKTQSMERQLDSVREQINQLQNKLVNNLEEEKDRQLISKIKNVGGFQGQLEQFVHPASRKYQGCFDSLMGPILKHLLCSDETSVKNLGFRLRQAGQLRTIVILENVKLRREGLNRTGLGKLGVFAEDTVEIDKNISNLQNFIKEYLWGKVVCDNLEVAWRILEKNIKGVKQIYTCDGNVVRSDGVVSSSGYQGIKKNYKYINTSNGRAIVMQSLEQLQAKRALLEQDIKIRSQKYGDSAILHHNLQLCKLEKRKQDLCNRLNFSKQLTNGQPQTKIPKGLERQIKQLQERKLNLEKMVSEMQRVVGGSEIFSTFISRHGLKILENFRQLQDLSGIQSLLQQKSKMWRQLKQIEQEMIKLESELKIKQQKLDKIEQKAKMQSEPGKKEHLQKIIAQSQNALVIARDSLAKIPNFKYEQLHFKSQIPQMMARLEIMKQKHKKMIVQSSQQERMGSTSLDYTPLEQNLSVPIQRATKKKLQMLQDQLQKQKKQLELSLEKQNLVLLQINPQIQEQKIIQQLEILSKEFSELDSRKTEVQQKITRLKEERKSIFIRFIDKLRPILKESYQLLTEQANSIGGKVDIYLQNDQNPCQYGIYYSPTPPTKRFVYDLQQLSGGQRTMASLALQYSIAIATDTPFLMLDETDAFLDASNVGRFIKLTKMAIRANGVQVILITHKRDLFFRCQSLVGLTKPLHQPFSHAYSLRIASDLPSNEVDPPEE